MEETQKDQNIGDSQIGREKQNDSNGNNPGKNNTISDLKSPINADSHDIDGIHKIEDKNHQHDYQTPAGDKETKENEKQDRGLSGDQEETEALRELHDKQHKHDYKTPEANGNKHEGMKQDDKGESETPELTTNKF